MEITLHVYHVIFGLCGFVGVYVCVCMCVFWVYEISLSLPLLCVCVCVCDIPKTIYNGQYWVSEREAEKGSEWRELKIKVGGGDVNPNLR